MAEKPALWFDSPGDENTQATLEAAARRAKELGIRQAVVATTSGKTALLTAEVLGPGTKVIGVTLQAGTWARYGAPDPEIVRQAEEKGVQFLTATHSLMGNVASAIQKKFGGIAPTELIAHVLYLFSQGTKVAVEGVAMAADSGLLNMEEDAIGIAGTNVGCDTALVIRPAYTTEFFEMKVREVIAMPRA